MSNIVRIPAATAGTVPAGGTDYQKQNDLLFAFGLWGMQAYPLDLTNNKVVKGAIFNVGGVLYKASADETITGTPSEYVKLTPISSGAQCSAEYVINLMGVSWSYTYNGYVDGSGNLYLFDEAKAFKNGIITAPKTFSGRNAVDWVAGDADEASARAAADSAEASARAAADSTLQININSEASTRASADSTLQGNINSKAASAKGSTSSTSFVTIIDDSGSSHPNAHSWIISAEDASNVLVCIVQTSLNQKFNLIGTAALVQVVSGLVQVKAISGTCQWRYTEIGS